jgi:general secretion pathway protein D
VLVGQDATSVGFSDLLTILLINSYTAVDYGTHVAVIPTASARQEPLPIITGKESRPEAEFVTRIITVKNVPATHLVPIIRPMIPQVGHFAALPCVNKLILVDTFGNVKRLSSLIETLDVGEPYTPPKCATSEPGSR